MQRILNYARNCLNVPRVELVENRATKGFAKNTMARCTFMQNNPMMGAIRNVAEPLKGGGFFGVPNPARIQSGGLGCSGSFLCSLSGYCRSASDLVCWVVWSEQA